jgi:hypothetical protein
MDIYIVIRFRRISTGNRRSIANQQQIFRQKSVINTVKTSCFCIYVYFKIKWQDIWHLNDILLDKVNTENDTIPLSIEGD